MPGYLQAMRRYASFSGRASRTEFWQFVGVLAGLMLVLGWLLLPREDTSVWPLMPFVLVILVHFLPGLAVSVRRLHDADYSGWWAALNLIPFAGGVMLLGFGLLPSTPGPNRFGPDSLGTRSMPPAGASEVPRDMIAEIERLAQLRASGSLSETEFEVMKAQALRGARVV